MGIKKNVASQHVTFPMVDKTDFATPETGISPSGIIRKDGGVSAALSNTISELTNGLYTVTLSQGETNADELVIRAHDSGASCATQFIRILTETITSAVSNVLSTLDDNVADKLASILADTTAIIVDTESTLDNKIDSILQDTNETLANKITSILTDTGTTLNNLATSILADTSYFLYNCCTDVDSSGVTSILDLLKDSAIGLDVLETITSDILEAMGADSDKITSILADTATISNLGGDSNDIDSILADTKSLIVDISLLNSAVDAYADNGASGISEVKSQLANATYGLDALETIASDVLEALDSAVAGPITSILEDTAEISNLGVVGTSAILSTLDHYFPSILTDTGTTLLNLANSIVDYVSDIESNVSNVLSTLDDVVGSQIASILADTGAILTDTSDLSNIKILAQSIVDDTSQILIDTSDLSNIKTLVQSALDDTSQILLDTVNISNLATPAQVNSQVVDALSVDTYAEPGQGDPLATTSIERKLAYLYKQWRNLKTATNASEKLYNDDGVTVDQKRAIGDDGTTFTKDEIIAGP